MTHPNNTSSFAARICAGLITSIGMVSFFAQPALAEIDVTVVDENGQPVNGFKWVLEQDPTYQVEPGQQSSDILALGFHRSYSPVAQTGETQAGTNTTTISGTDAESSPYFLSVIPFADDVNGRIYTIGGANVSDGESVTVVTHTGPIPTAQISILIFEDNAPINGAPDFGAGLGAGPEISERPLTVADGTFAVILEDAGGRYGISGGQVTLDAFGNPLGTQYQDEDDPNFDPADAAFIFALGDGTFAPDNNGFVHIENLAPGKYGIQVVPPAGGGWVQTSTIEGSKVVDAWVKGNEPAGFVEIGPPGPHVFVGFVRDIDRSAAPAGATITGQIRNNHLSRSPDFAFFTGNPFPGCYVGLNSGGGIGSAIASQPCDDDSTFSIDNVPDGDYALVVWDKSLNIVIASLPISIVGGADANLGDVPVFGWFARLESSVFVDSNENGIRDPGEQDMPADSTAVNLRFRDGTVYQSFPVDTEGLAPFDTVFPFFHWLVAEVDFATLKATGATYTVDNGGPVDLAGDNVLNPQPQVCTQGDIDNGAACTIGDPLGDTRTLTGEVLTLGIQTFLGQTNRIEFGKVPYSGQENGGISGVLFYATTRAEDDPRFAAGEEWEPGIPRAQVNLYQADGDGNIFDQDGDGVITAPDVDNAPLGNFPGPEDIDRGALDGGVTGRFDYGDAVQVTWSDSWDDSIPEGCQGDVFTAFPGTAEETDTDCYDGLRNFNQIREAVFDGGYAFASFVVRDNDNTGAPFGDVVYGTGETFGTEGGALPTNLYIVESITPQGYEHVKEEDRNVDFGDEYVPQPNRGVAKAGIDRAILEKLDTFEIGANGITVDLTAPAACVGDARAVPALFSFLTFADGVTPLPGVDENDPDSQAPFAGDSRQMCDRKVVALTPGKNSAADFFMFTDVPVAAHVVGGILDDLSNEFDPNSPNFGEKYAPPWLPVVFRDWTGREISRVHADQFGKYNAMLPSTYTINQPHASGVSPNMITACMNDASPMVNPAAATDPDAPALIPDPFRDPRYTQFCYTFQYMPGAITYLDTPVVPVSAFAGKDQFPLDCAVANDTPEIYSVNSGGNRGPWVNSSANGNGPRTLNIRSVGNVEVLNPNFGPNGDTNRLVTRDYRFGNATGSVFLISEAGVPFALNIRSWNQQRIRARLAQGFAPGRYQLAVEKSDGTRTQVGVTVTVSAGQIDRIRVPVDQPTIQAAIDAAQPGTLITVAPGIYEELIVMYKPVQLQGWGAGSTTINATAAPGERLQAWRDTLIDTQAAGEWDPLPGQEQGLGGGLPETTAFLRDEGAGITVVASNPDPDAGPIGPNVFGDTDVAPRIDGFTITGAVRGGGILVNGYADNLLVSNNRVVSNSGNTGGGVRFGDAGLFDEGESVDAQNNDVVVRNNHIAQNGTLSAAGGGVALFTGTDNYDVANNYICGNFSLGNGAGIGHLGLSDDGTIRNNRILFNQTFNQGTNVHGGGIFIGGVGGTLGLSAGSGSVLIDSNLIQGNHAGAGHGAGIRTQFVNGRDVARRRNRPGRWHRISVFNNMIVNNVAALSGGGISMQDTARIRIHNNTIANNDSTATAGLAFATANSSSPQPGVGIAAHAHIDDPATRTLIDVIGNGVNFNRYRQGISNPIQRNNVVWHNRQFFWQIVQSINTNDVADECFEILPNVGATVSACGTPANQPAVYDDMAVIGNAIATLRPRYTVFSETYAGDGAGNATNVLANAADLALAAPYVNGDAGQTLIQQELTAGIAAQPALDEGGNFIDVRYGPLTPTGDYHIGLQSSVAMDAGLINPVRNNVELQTDIDGDPRPGPSPLGPIVDIGADETNGSFPGVTIVGQAKTGVFASGGVAGAASVATSAAASSVTTSNSGAAVVSIAISLDAENDANPDEEDDEETITTFEISPFEIGTDSATTGAPE
jgi:parallel beta-helix repeat protein